MNLLALGRQSRTFSSLVFFLPCGFRSLWRSPADLSASEESSSVTFYACLLWLSVVGAHKNVRLFSDTACQI